MSDDQQPMPPEGSVKAFTITVYAKAQGPHDVDHMCLAGAEVTIHAESGAYKFRPSEVCGLLVELARTQANPARRAAGRAAYDLAVPDPIARMLALGEDS